MNNPNKHVTSHPLNAPVAAERTVRNLGEERKSVETAIGLGIESAFSVHADHVVTDEVSRCERLTLYVAWQEIDIAPISLARTVEESGSQTVFLSFEAGWPMHWRYTEGPDQEPSFVACTKDAESGEFAPKAKPTPTADHPSPFDPTSDEQVVSWGKVWARNLEQGTPIKPRPMSSMRKLGRRALGRPVPSYN